VKSCAVVLVVLASLLAPSAAGHASEREQTPPFLGGLRSLHTAASQPGPPASVVLIAGTIGTKPAYGCAVIIEADRSTVTMLTAAHNLMIQRPSFVTAAGERLHIERTVAVGGHDLALVTASRPWRRYDVARIAVDARPGTRVSIWGPVGSEPFTLQEGTVREMDPRVTDAPAGAFAIDCAACGHGDSGTGVFNAREELVGIVVAGYSAGQQRLFVLGERYRPDATLATVPLSDPGP
jgi:S1-C subfamily serine protease